MKNILVAIICMLGVFQSSAQDVKTLMDEARKLEQRLKEDSAFDKYKDATALQPNNGKILYKLAELCSNKGWRETELTGKFKWYNDAKMYAEKALASDSTDAANYYILAFIYGRFAAIEEKREAFALDMKMMKLNSGIALSLNPEFAKAWHVLGKWHLDVVSLNPVKTTAIKVLNGGLPDANIDSAISYMEKCKSMEPYYCLNFYNLGEAYNFNRNYEKAINVLEQLQKLPTRRQDDPAIKSEGAILLQKLQ